MMCPKCGMELKDKAGYEAKPEMETEAKTAVLDDLLKLLEGSAGAKLGKPEAVSVEMITTKDDEDEEEEA